MIKSRLLQLFFAPLLLLITGCGLVDYFYLPAPEDTAHELWESGNAAMNATDYFKAVEYFDKLNDRYPFSPYTVQAELALADAYFLNGNYVEAMDAYIKFESMHPRHKEIPYVLYQVGLSGYKSFTSIDRPQIQVEKGLQYLQRLWESYPETKYAVVAKDYIVKCRCILAQHELFIGDFYMRIKKFGGAWQRYQYVVDNYKNLSDIHKYASRQAELAYLRLQKQESQEFMEKSHNSWKHYFNWL
ncbi:Outer membrane protein assembly factor BamD [Desulfovibrionales bacterium]